MAVGVDPFLYECTDLKPATSVMLIHRFGHGVRRVIGDSIRGLNQ